MPSFQGLDPLLRFSFDVLVWSPSVTLAGKHCNMWCVLAHGRWEQCFLTKLFVGIGLLWWASQPTIEAGFIVRTLVAAGYSSRG